MLISEKKIKQGYKKLIKIDSHVKEKSKCYHVGSDPTRLKIIFLLKEYKELCVSDLAKILKISISAISHQLALLERMDLVKKNKMGKIVCYSLREKVKKTYCLY